MELGRLAIPTFTVGASFTEELDRLAIPTFTVVIHSGCLVPKDQCCYPHYLRYTIQSHIWLRSIRSGGVAGTIADLEGGLAMIPTWTPTKRKYGKSGPSSPHVQNSTPPSSGPIRVLARHQRSLRRTWRLRDRSDAPPLPASTPIPPQPLAAPVCQACGPGTETSNLGQCGRCA